MNISAREEIIPLTPQTLQILLAMAAHRNMTGADVARQMRKDSGGLIEMSSGSLYPRLRQLKEMGAISNPNPRRTTVFRLTPIGLKILEMEADRIRDAAELAGERRWAVARRLREEVARETKMRGLEGGLDLE